MLTELITFVVVDGIRLPGFKFRWNQSSVHWNIQSKYKLLYFYAMKL